MDSIEYTVLVEVCKDDLTHIDLQLKKSWCTLWTPESWGNLQGSPAQTLRTTGKGGVPYFQKTNEECDQRTMMLH